MLLLGKTGVGKSTLLRNMIVQDIQAGRGCLFIDPHGDESERLLDFVPPWRTADVIYLDPTDLTYPIGFNLLEREPAEDRSLVASNIVSIFKHFWADAWGARSEYLLLCSVAAVLDYPVGQGGVSLLAVQRLLSDADYRRRVVSYSRNQAVRTFWEHEFPTWAPQFAAQALSPIENKLGALLSSPATRLMLGQAEGGLRLSEAMDAQKIIIARLPKGLLGEDTANLIGSLLVNAVQQAAMRRAKIRGGRAGRLCLLPRRVRQLHDRTRSPTSCRNCASTMSGLCSRGSSWRSSGPRCAPRSSATSGRSSPSSSGTTTPASSRPILDPYGIEALTWLGRGQVAVRISTEGNVAVPFIGETFPEIGYRYAGRRPAVLAQSRRRYGTPRARVGTPPRQGSNGGAREGRERPATAIRHGHRRRP